MVDMLLKHEIKGKYLPHHDNCAPSIRSGLKEDQLDY